MTVAEVSATKGEHDKQKSCVTKSNKIQTAGINSHHRDAVPWYQFPGGGVLSKCLQGEAPPRGPNPYLLYTIFHEKGTPFTYLV